jgi:translation initiation factor IF-3
MSTSDALKLAQSKQLDLIEIAPNSKPPVCKISDYGKYNYERQKREKQTKKHTAQLEMKEIRFNPNTDKHDIEFKTKHLHQFVIDGHKVKATVTFKGRMITHPEFGRKLMEDIIARLEDVGKLEAPPRMEGKQLIAYFTPDKHKITAYKTKEQKEQRLREKTENREAKTEKKEEAKSEESQLNQEQV